MIFHEPDDASDAQRSLSPPLRGTKKKVHAPFDSIAERIRALGVANFGKVTMELFSRREFGFVSRRFVTGSWGVIMVNDFMVRSFEGMEMDQ